MRPFLTTILFTLWTALSFAQNATITYNHQAILVSDMKRSVLFYQEILGLKEIEDKTEQPHIRWFSMGGDKQLHIIEEKVPVNIPPKGTHMAFTSKDLDTTIEHLRSQKIYFENWQGTPDTTNPRPDGVRQIYLQDPDGYWIEINGQ
ncbi:VOC family protein [Robertkochia sediminum]|uniref:VOC family protein n=1 Tax=Robertkochia sediminum TaxID=2785326 RepID=UPI0019346EF5|nr:VOC family protein [Robertkochia sediminum]MBL7472679.1 VOC family protein [Robertkochia sediminum]